jgi:Fur family ferric uptake transcriptional regulator
LAIVAYNLIDNFCNKEMTMSCISSHSQTLRARGFRMTHQRLAILQALHDAGHLSPSQLYAKVRRTGMTEATVYRNLEFLAGNGIVHPAHLPGGHMTYELAGHDHHHMVCRSCGAQVDLEPASLQKLFSQLEQETGYRLDAGHFTFSGLCPICQTQGDA